MRHERFYSGCDYGYEVPARVAAVLAETSCRTIARWCQHVEGLGRPYRPRAGRGKLHWAVNLEKLRSLIEKRKRSTTPDVLPRGTVRMPTIRARSAREGTSGANATVVSCHVCAQPSPEPLPPRLPGPVGLTYAEAATELGVSHETIVIWASRIPHLKVLNPGWRRPRLDPLFLAAVDSHRVGGKLPIRSLTPGRPEHDELRIAVNRFCQGYFVAGMVGDRLPKWPSTLMEIWRSAFYRERYCTSPDKAAHVQPSQAEVHHGTT